MNQRSRLLAAAVIAAGLVAYLRRPVKHPATKGTWQPAAPQRSRR